MRKIFCAFVIVIAVCVSSASFGAALSPSANLNFNESVNHDIAGNEWTVFGDPVLSSKEYVTGGKSLFLDGESYLQAKNQEAFNFPGEFTLTAWVYPLEWVTDSYGGETFAVFSRWLHGVSTLYLFNIDNGKLTFYSDFAGTVSVTGKTEIPLKKWTHIAVTRDSEKVVRLFVNGKLDGEKRITQKFTSDDYPMTIGASSNAMRKSVGYIDDWCVYKSCLYTRDFRVPERSQGSGRENSDGIQGAEENIDGFECKCGCKNSPADEIRKFKELLNDGIITQEEFDAVKKRLLGL